MDWEKRFVWVLLCEGSGLSDQVLAQMWFWGAGGVAALFSDIPSSYLVASSVPVPTGPFIAGNGAVWGLCFSHLFFF